MKKVKELKKICPSCGDEFQDSYGFVECEGCRNLEEDEPIC